MLAHSLFMLCWLRDGSVFPERDYAEVLLVPLRGMHCFGLAPLRGLFSFGLAPPQGLFIFGMAPLHGLFIYDMAPLRGLFFFVAPIPKCHIWPLVLSVLK